MRKTAKYDFKRALGFAIVQAIKDGLDDKSIVETLDEFFAEAKAARVKREALGIK